MCSCNIFQFGFTVTGYFCDAIGSINHANTIKFNKNEKTYHRKRTTRSGKIITEDLASISETSCAVADQLGKPYHWIQSFVTENKIYCIHIAESEEVVREHAQKCNFPITEQLFYKVFKQHD